MKKIPARGLLPHLAVTSAWFGRNPGLAQVHGPCGTGRSIDLNLNAGETKTPQSNNNKQKKAMKDQILLNVEELEARIAPDTVGALHNNPDNPNNNNDHNAVPKGALPEAQGGN